MAACREVGRAAADFYGWKTVQCVRDGKLITGTSAGCAVPFALALVAALKGEEKAREIAEQIVIR